MRISQRVFRRFVGTHHQLTLATTYYLLWYIPIFSREEILSHNLSI